MKQELEQLPFWRDLSDTERQLLCDRAVVRQFAPEQVVGGSGTTCMGMVRILSGGLRVSLISDEGREITLFRLEAPDCCMMTASCVVRQINFDTLVTATQKTELLVIPAPVFSELVEKNVYVRAFLYETETVRFSQTIRTMEQLLFRRFDRRLAGYLLETAEKTGSTTLKLTQEEIARDINSAREVVARMLRSFAGEGLVEVQRKQLQLRDPEGLRAVAEGRNNR